MTRSGIGAVVVVALLAGVVVFGQSCTTSAPSGPSPSPPVVAPVEPDIDVQEGEEKDETERPIDADTFAGHARAAAKTTIADVPVEDFADLPTFLASLPSDDAMRHHVPKIPEASDSNRVAEEKRNVRVHAYLWAAKKEADNDYHLMLGTKTGAPFATAEVTGLPTSGSFRARLAKARQEFVALVAPHVPGPSKYQHITPPVPVVVTGSIFYDIDHAPGAVGPSWAKPTTAWEIHPVTEIRRE